MSNLANTILVGVQKCGTTTLYYSLKHHSQIEVPIDPDRKEINKEVDFFFDDAKWMKGIEWYKSHFKSENKIFLDASINYLTKPAIYKRIADVCPDAKLLICLRNPVDRAYSQYNHYMQDLPTTENWDWNSSLNFEDNIQFELNTRSDFMTEFLHFLGRGVYINQIEQLLQYFDPSQIHFTIMEHWKNNYHGELVKILKFLNLNYEPLPLIPRHYRQYVAEPMSLKVRELLKEFYAPYNQRLFKYLNFEIIEWL